MCFWFAGSRRKDDVILLQNYIVFSFSLLVQTCKYLIENIYSTSLSIPMLTNLAGNILGRSTHGTGYISLIYGFKISAGLPYSS
jgi:hypothetical protein